MLSALSSLLSRCLTCAFSTGSDKATLPEAQIAAMAAPKNWDFIAFFFRIGLDWIG